MYSSIHMDVAFGLRPRSLIPAHVVCTCTRTYVFIASFAEGIATAVVNPRIRLSVQLTNILMQPRHLGGESLQGQIALRTAVRDKKWGATFNESI